MYYVVDPPPVLLAPLTALSWHRDCVVSLIQIDRDKDKGEYQQNCPLIIF